MYGSSILTTDNYQITLNEAATSGDPFNGAQNNSSNFIKARVDFGTNDAPCVSHLIKETASSTTANITFSGVDGAACSFSITASDSSVYTADMNVVSANVTFGSSGTITPVLSADLYNQGNKKVGIIEFDFDTITFKDNDGNLFE